MSDALERALDHVDNVCARYGVPEEATSELLRQIHCLWPKPPVEHPLVSLQRGFYSVPRNGALHDADR